MNIVGAHPGDTSHEIPRDMPDGTLRRVAWIREDECIGCVKCINACPVDAIVGAAKQTHTVIRNDCTGCDLCVPACPVDCIEMHPLADQRADPVADENARRRSEARTIRLAGERQARSHAIMPTVRIAPTSTTSNHTQQQTTDAWHLKKLQAAADMTKKQHKEAMQALARAQRAGHADMATMQARVDALRHKADSAQQALAAALPQQAAGT